MLDYQSIIQYYNRHFKQDFSAKMALWIIIGLVILALLGDIIAHEKSPALIPYSATTLDMQNAGFVSPFEPQSIDNIYKRHWLGTDQIGRDIAAGLIAGTRVALLVGIGGMIVALCIGVMLGLTAGFYGDNRFKTTILGILGGGGIFLIPIIFINILIKKGLITWCLLSITFILFLWFFIKILSVLLKKKPISQNKITIPLDSIIMRIVAIMQSIPSIIWLLGFVTIIQRFTIFQLVIVIGITFFPAFTQLSRGEMIRIRDMDFMVAARGLGLSTRRILFRHALPNILTPLLVGAIFGVAQCVLLEAGISFIGIGLPAEQVTWGTMLNQARTDFSAWWLAVFPGLMIFLTVISLNKISEVLKGN
jgi:peptide/nickel transport system permease protein